MKNVIVQRNDGGSHAFQNGLVYRNNGKWLCVWADGGELIIQSIEDENGKSVLAEIQPGDRFVTPHEDLDNARGRIAYGPSGLIVKVRETDSLRA